MYNVQVFNHPPKKEKKRKGKKKSKNVAHTTWKPCLTFKTLSFNLISSHFIAFKKKKNTGVDIRILLYCKLFVKPLENISHFNIKIYK